MILVLVALLPGVAARELECALVGVRAREAEMHLVRKAGLAEKLGQPGVGFRVVEIAHVQHAGGRGLGQGLVDPRIVVAQRVDRDAGHAVQVSVALGVVEGAALAPLQHKGGAPVDAQHVRLLQLNDVL